MIINVINTNIDKYISTITDKIRLKDNSMTIDNLKLAILYYYRLISKEGNNNKVILEAYERVYYLYSKKRH